MATLGVQDQVYLQDATTREKVVSQTYNTSWTVTGWHYATFTIAANQTDSQVNFGNLAAARHVWIQTDQDCTVNIGGTGGTDIPCAKKLELHSAADITLIYITTGASITTVTVVLAK